MENQEAGETTEGLLDVNVTKLTGNDSACSETDFASPSTSDDFVTTSGGLESLTIDKALKNILGYSTCPNDDASQLRGDSTELDNVRLLCRQWHELATTALRLNRQPPPRIPGGEGGQSLSEFLEIMKRSSLIPEESSRFSGLLLCKNYEGCFINFLSSSGSSIAKLKIFENVTAIRTSKLELTRNSLPGISSLGFQLMANTPPFRAFEVLSPLFLAAAENLESFELTISKNYYQEAPKGLIDMFLKAVSAHLPKSLKSLKLNLQGYDHKVISGFPGFSGEFRLTRFEYIFLGQIDKAKLHEFLVTHSETLRSLKLVNTHPFYVAAVTLPELRRLEELEVRKLEAFVISGKNFVRMRTLTTDVWDAKQGFRAFLKVCNGNQSVKKLILPEYVDTRHLRRIGLVFPKLKGIEVPADLKRKLENVLEAIYVHLPGIEELTICNPGVNLDAALSGVTNEDVEGIRGTKDWNCVDITVLRKRLSLINLKKLRSLVIHGKGAIITDFSAHFVLLQMESLRELRCSAENFSSVYMGKLENKLKLNRGPFDELPRWRARGRRIL